MNILQILPGKVWGGAEQYILDLSKALVDKGHNVMIMTRNSKAVTERMNGEFPFTSLPFVFSLDLYSIAKLAAFLRDNAIDVIHVHDAMFVPLMMIAKSRSHSEAKVVLTRHIARKSKVNPLFRGFFRRLHRIIFVSNLAKSLWQQANAWMPREKCVVVHNSIPSNAAEPSGELHNRYNIPRDTPIIVFTGRVRKSKGCGVLVEALSQLSDLPFFMVFVGKCKPLDYEHTLTEMAQKHGIDSKIAFYGFTDKVRTLIQEANIGVAPSIVREACPLSPMEFMQAGKCIIATNNGAQPEYITDGETGLLVDPNNVEQLASALKCAITDVAKRNEIAHNAQLYFNSQMNYSTFISKILTVYSD